MYQVNDMHRKVLDEELIYLVLSVVEEIPIGFVSTYGQIAALIKDGINVALIGRPKNARLVGKILSMSEYFGKYPCHRVVDHSGRVAPHFKEQKRLLQEEGITFRDENHVDIKKHKWKIEG